MSIQLGFQQGDFGPKTWRAVAAEFIGTGLFVFIGTASVVVANAGYYAAGSAPPGFPNAGFVIAVALAHGLGIFIAVAATANISGGHINPAVTFGMAAAGKIKISTGALYVAAQLIAAVLAVLLLKAVVAGPLEQGLGAHGLNKSILDDQIGSGAGAGLLVEVALTFVLVFVVFATAVDPRGPRHLAPIAIGLAIMADHLAGIPLTGASMNPARSFGPAVVANIWTDHWVYWLGPLIGALLAAIIYELVFLTREEEQPAAPSPAPPPAPSPAPPPTAG